MYCQVLVKQLAVKQARLVNCRYSGDFPWSFFADCVVIEDLTSGSFSNGHWWRSRETDDWCPHTG